VILIVAKFYERFRSSRIVEGAMTGLRPAVIGLIAASLLSIGTTVFTPAVSTRWLPVAISGCLFILMSILSFKKKHPILIIALSAVIGIITGYTLGL
jgi:chromate transporter